MKRTCSALRSSQAGYAHRSTCDMGHSSIAWSPSARFRCKMSPARPVAPLIGMPKSGERRDYTWYEAEIPGIPPRCDLEARLRLILLRVQEIRVHPGWPSALGLEPMLAQGLNLIIRDTCMLLRFADPCSDRREDQAALQSISESADRTLISLEEGLARLDVYAPAESTAEQSQADAGPD